MTHISELIDNNIQDLLKNCVRPEDKEKFTVQWQQMKKDINDRKFHISETERKRQLKRKDIFVPMQPEKI